MANYAIMRCKKLVTMGCVASSLQHCYRERETLNADMERTSDNTHMAARSTDEAMRRLHELLPDKRRKDAVLAVEYVMTASPEWWKQASQEQQERFFGKACGWLAGKYGTDRIITATIHRDETSPHLSAFVVPLTKDGRLSAKEFIGGRAKMSHDQTAFADAVRDFGLVRGVEGSRARHNRVQAFYEALERPSVEVTISPESIEPRRYEPQGFAERIGLFKRVESPEAVAERLTMGVRQAYEPTMIAASGAREMSRKAKETQETARDMQERLKPLIEILRPLNDAERRTFLVIAERAKEKLLDQRMERLRERQHEREARREQTKQEQGRSR